MTDPNEPVSVFESADALEVELALNLLREAGVPTTTRGGSAEAYVSAVLGEAFGGVQSVLVPAGDEVRAREVLERAWGSPDDADEP